MIRDGDKLNNTVPGEILSSENPVGKRFEDELGANVSNQSVDGGDLVTATPSLVEVFNTSVGMVQAVTSQTIADYAERELGVNADIARGVYRKVLTTMPNAPTAEEKGYVQRIVRDEEGVARGIEKIGFITFVEDHKTGRAPRSLEANLKISGPVTEEILQRYGEKLKEIN